MFFTVPRTNYLRASKSAIGRNRATSMAKKN
jgi:hypothetical protein